MNIKRISVLAVLLAIIVAALRNLQFMYRFDAETGFFMDNGIISVIALVLSLAVPIVAFFAAIIKKTGYGRVKFIRNIPAGIGALVCTGGVAVGLKLLYEEYMAQGRGIADTAMGISFENPFMYCTLALILFMLSSAVAWSSGRAVFQKLKPLYLLSVIWALSLILYAFIHYSISVLITENIFIIVLSCVCSVAFMAQARFYSDLNPQGKSLKLLVPSTVLAAMLMTGYALSGIAMRLLDIHTKNEVSLPLEVIILSVGLYMFLVLFSLRFTPLAVPSKPKNSEGKRFKVDIKREL